MDHVEVLTAPGLYGGGYGAAAPVGFGSSLEDRVSKADVYNSPGWRRLQENQSHRPVRQPQEARHVVIDMEAASPYVIGDRVFHQKFGYGEIISNLGKHESEREVFSADVKSLMPTGEDFRNMAPAVLRGN